METVATILRDKGTNVFTVAPTASVLDAVQTMCAHRVGAVLVCDGTEPCGIFSERDLMARVILARKDPEQTKIAEVMSAEVAFINPTTEIQEAMAIMSEHRCRHLPVVSDGQITGMISIGDLVRWQSRHQEFEIRMLEDYICGRYPG